MFAAAALIALVRPSPAPTATPLKTIVNIRTSAFCGQVRSLAIPFQQIRLRNAVLRVQMANVQQQLLKRGDSIFAPDWRAFYGSQIDMLATSVAQNLHSADLLLAQSWKQSPKGTNSKIDALRASVQNTVDAERALNNAVLMQAGYLQDVQGFKTIADATISGPRGGPQTSNAIQDEAGREQIFAGPTPAPDSNQPPPAKFNRSLPAPESFAQHVGDSEAAFDQAFGQAMVICP
jgi:hypothetical protein